MLQWRVILHCIYMYMCTPKSPRPRPALCCCFLFLLLTPHWRSEDGAGQKECTQRVSCEGPLRCTEILIHRQVFAVEMPATRTQSTTFHWQFHLQPLINAGSNLKSMADRDVASNYIHLAIQFILGWDCMELCISCTNMITFLQMEITIHRA